MTDDRVIHALREILAYMLILQFLNMLVTAFLSGPSTETIRRIIHEEMAKIRKYGP